METVRWYHPELGAVKAIGCEKRSSKNLLLAECPPSYCGLGGTFNQGSEQDCT